MTDLDSCAGGCLAGLSAVLRNSRLWLLGLAALLALAAAAALLPAQLNAAPPDDIELELSLVEDSDNVVPPGSSLTVRATLKYTGSPRGLTPLPITAASLFVSGDQEWESIGRNRLAVTNQSLVGGAFGPYTSAPDGGKFVAMDGRTMVIGGTGIVVVDLENPQNYRNVVTVNAAGINNYRDKPTGTPYHGGDPGSAMATTNARGFGRSVAVWHETDDIAWVFVGSKFDTVNTHPNIGRLYIYKVVYSGDARPTLSLERVLEPLESDYMNDYSVAWNGGKAKALFGSSVAISANGKFLAVAAAEINEIGAVYVYERPGLRTPTHGPTGSTTNTGGDWADWGDLIQPSAMKLTVIAVPDWDNAGGVYETTAGSSGSPRVPNNLRHWTADCDATCQRIWSYTYTDFGKDALAISEDGLTIAVGAEQKNLPEAWTRGRYSWIVDTSVTPWTVNSDFEGHFRNGEAYVFTPGAAERAEGFWRPTNNQAGTRHIDFRWTPTTAGELSHKLQAQPYGEGPGVQNFGARIDVSNDGRSVAVTAPGAPGQGVDAWIDNYQKKTPTREGKVYVFNRPGSAWPNGGLDNSPDATFQLASGIDSQNFGSHNVDFSPDSRRLAITDSTGAEGGRAWIFTGTSGAWRDATTASATGLYSPLAQGGAGFGWATYELGGGDANADNRLMVGRGRQHLWVYDKDLNLLPGDPDNGGPCRFDPIDGVAFNGDDTVACELALGNAVIEIPPGAPDGTFTISGNVTVDGETVTDQLQVRIGAVDEVTSVEFGFDTQADGSSYPSSVARTGVTSTRMLLKILNENGGASARGAISSVLFTTTQGRLSASLAGSAGACRTTGSLTCQLTTPATALNAGNADKIRLTLTHPGGDQTGAATVRVNVLASDGESYSPEPLTVTFAGMATELAIAKPSVSLLNFNTCDSASDEGCISIDNRDVLTLAVTAADRGGNPTAVPSSFGLARITGPDGRAVGTDKIAVDWPLRRDGDDAGDEVTSTDPLVTRNGAPQARLDVNVEETAKLTAGEYTLELRAGTLRTTQTFRISGGPAAIDLSPPESAPQLNSQVRLTVMVTDEDGNAVPDGTAVTWQDRPVGATTVLVRLDAQRVTRGGEASANFLVVAPGSAYVMAESGTVADAELLRVSAATAPRASLAESLSSTKPNDFSTWLARTRVLASTLLPALDGVSAILLWEGTNEIWLRYGQTEDGRVIPGSTDYLIELGAVLWLGNGE